MSESALIDDGCNLTGKIERRAGLWPEVEFIYRHALPEAVFAHRAAVRKNPSEETRLDTLFLLKYLMSWNIRAKPDGPVADLTERNLSLCHMEIRVGFYQAVTAWTSPAMEADLKN
jgi:hypothetical protein